jgi:PHD/YefM family antitoxin component YafN of YafNO toxin-antitoxin module
MVTLTKQIVPISDMHLRQGETLAKIKDGPVYLAQRSSPVAVLVAADYWDATISRLAELEWHERARQSIQAARASSEPDVSYDDFMRELKAFHEQSS